MIIKIKTFTLLQQKKQKVINKTTILEDLDEKNDKQNETVKVESLKTNTKTKTTNFELQLEEATLELLNDPPIPNKIMKSKKETSSIPKPPIIINNNNNLKVGIEDRQKSTFINKSIIIDQSEIDDNSATLRFDFEIPKPSRSQIVSKRLPDQILTNEDSASSTIPLSHHIDETATLEYPLTPPQQQQQLKQNKQILDEMSTEEEKTPKKKLVKQKKTLNSDDDTEEEKINK